MRWQLEIQLDDDHDYGPREVPYGGTILAAMEQATRAIRRAMDQSTGIATGTIIDPDWQPIGSFGFVPDDAETAP